MLPFLDQLLNEQLVAGDKKVEQSAEYHAQKDALEACISSWLEDVGEDKRLFTDAVFVVAFIREKQMLHDAFMRGFSLGALASMKGHLNEETAAGLPPEREVFEALGKGYEDYLQSIAARVKANSADAVGLKTQVFAAAERMLRLKGKPRFAFGYCLGVVTIADVFDYRANFLEEAQRGTA